jgi:hypothetical protein
MTLHRALPAALGAVATAALLAGCWPDPTPDATPTGVALTPPPVIDLPTPAVGAVCISEVTAPDMPIWELSAALPVEGLDGSGIEALRAYERGAGPCSADVGAPTRDECRPGAPLNGTSLWRPAERITELAFADGATRSVIAEVDARLEDDDAVSYRLRAWSYPDTEAAEGSALYALLDGCEPSTLTAGAAEARTLAAGDQPYVALFHVEHVVYLVEGRLESSDGLPAPVMSHLVERWPDFAFG